MTLADLKKTSGKANLFPSRGQDSNRRLGYYNPLNLAGDSHDQELRACAGGDSQERFQIAAGLDNLFFCDQGCYRSVSCCRLIEVAVSEWRSEHPACN